ncbi:hypothetical protein BpHYR1_049082 [Brachionus plicatilis]|uniref:Uncharacterized protein n=1 Tax=Brachionus plicatilis TaxID=10195 RepID=A0A3M7Q1T6_BRAPC|nr:hypothetical protein BpHYR1_049082 [Brachionus plicatilis]
MGNIEICSYHKHNDRLSICVLGVSLIEMDLIQVFTYCTIIFVLKFHINIGPWNDYRQRSYSKRNKFYFWNPRIDIRQKNNQKSFF